MIKRNFFEKRSFFFVGYYLKISGFNFMAKHRINMEKYNENR